MSKLRALVEEVDAALEVHIAGRSVTRFNRTAFILADDAVELASKLFLIRRDLNWSDRRANNSFKNFRDFTGEVQTALPAATDLIQAFRERRERRNGFFHSANLLDLTLHNRTVDEALVDLLDYCALLFGAAWTHEVANTQFMHVAEKLVRLDLKACRDAHLRGRIDDVLSKLPRFGGNPRAKGCAVVFHASDQHLSLAVRYGGNDLLTKLEALDAPPP